jgi:hypothetical protein
MKRKDSERSQARLAWADPRDGRRKVCREFMAVSFSQLTDMAFRATGTQRRATAQGLKRAGQGPTRLARDARDLPVAFANSRSRHCAMGKANRRRIACRLGIRRSLCPKRRILMR